MKGGPVQHQKNYDPDHYQHNAYDERDALRQYTNQIPLASQSLYHFEVRKEKDVKKMTAELIKDSVDFVVAKNPKFAAAKRVDFSDEIGDGAVSAAILPDGHLIVTWDGASRMTLNILTLGEKYELVPPKAEVPDTILTEHKSLVVTLVVWQLAV